MNSTRVKIFLLLTLFLSPCYAAAGEPDRRLPAYSFLSDNYDIHAGVFSPQLDTRIQVNRDPHLPGTVIDLEGVFGLPEQQTRPWLEINYRAAFLGTVRFVYFDTDRSGTRTIEKDIRFGERVFTAPARVSAFTTARYYWLTYQFLVTRNEYTEFGISPGIMVADVKSGLSLESGGVDQRKEVAFVAPMPVLGLYLSTQFLSRVFLRNTVRVMDVTVGDYAASLYNYTIGLDYNPFRNWGIGIGYYFNLLDIKKGFINYNGNFSADSSGGLIYLKYFFS